MEKEIKERIEEFEENTKGSIPEHVVNYLIDMGYFTCPASSGHHGAYPGGLYAHSHNVHKYLDMYTEKLGLKWERKESPAIIGRLHDICKLDEYKNGEKIESPLRGHGDKSVIILLSMMNLTAEEIMCIRYHMGPYEGKEIWNSYNQAVGYHPNILYTHLSDMMTSQIYQI